MLGPSHLKVESRPFSLELTIGLESPSVTAGAACRFCHMPAARTCAGPLTGPLGWLRLPSRRGVSVPPHSMSSLPAGPLSLRASLVLLNRQLRSVRGAGFGLTSTPWLADATALPSSHLLGRTPEVGDTIQCPFLPSLSATFPWAVPTVLPLPIPETHPPLWTELDAICSGAPNMTSPRSSWTRTSHLGRSCLHLSFSHPGMNSQHHFYLFTP